MSSTEQTQGAGFAARMAGPATSERVTGAAQEQHQPVAGADRPPTSPIALPGAVRRVSLTLAHLDPWSVMKLSFLLSVALGVALVVASGVLWTVLDGMGVFADVNRVASEIAGEPFDLLDYVGFAKVLSLTTVIAVVDVVLLTALSTLAAFLYNVASTLVGGVHLTLSDD